MILLPNLDILNLLIYIGVATYRFQATQWTDNPFICTNITKGWHTLISLPWRSVLGYDLGANHTCHKTESIFFINIPYKDIPDVMNDVFLVYRVKLYKQELERQQPLILTKCRYVAIQMCKPNYSSVRSQAPDSCCIPTVPLCSYNTCASGSQRRL